MSTNEQHSAAREQLPDLVTIQQAAAAAACSPLTIRRRIAEGKLRATRVGPRAIRIDRESLHEMLTGQPLGAA